VLWIGAQLSVLSSSLGAFTMYISCTLESPETLGNAGFLRVHSEVRCTRPEMRDKRKPADFCGNPWMPREDSNLD